MYFTVEIMNKVDQIFFYESNEINRAQFYQEFDSYIQEHKEELYSMMDYNSSLKIITYYDDGNMDVEKYNIFSFKPKFGIINSDV
ncbi:MAG: hypothetical protein Satyrvirus1_21 [Satyrvirus sp.]|uniref:Uncharacterized protein n=1 Tax=Satyrvirus sp. TaxID=2487771 RepID=A0A3G5ACH9_9VIRU|nr:MAG: hypothetical protein Satyrvirus1_21 [Satyrvirus sp.]